MPEVDDIAKWAAELAPGARTYSLETYAVLGERVSFVARIRADGRNDRSSSCSGHLHALSRH